MVVIVRDTTHRQQRLAIIEELGGMQAVLTIPNSTPESHEAREHSYYFRDISLDRPTQQGGLMSRPLVDGHSDFSETLAGMLPRSCQLNRSRGNGNCVV